MQEGAALVKQILSDYGAAMTILTLISFGLSFAIYVLYQRNQALVDRAFEITKDGIEIMTELKELLKKNGGKDA